MPKIGWNKSRRFVLLALAVVLGIVLAIQSSLLAGPMGDPEPNVEKPQSGEGAAPQIEREAESEASVCQISDLELALYLMGWR